MNRLLGRLPFLLLLITPTLLSAQIDTATVYSTITTSAVYSIEWVGGGKFYAGGDKWLLYSADSGETWVHRAPPAGVTPLEIVYAPDSSIWVVSSGAVHQQKVGEMAWFQKRSGQFHSLQFNRLTNNAWIIDDADSSLLRSTNNGLIWNKVEAAGNGIYSYTISNDGSIWTARPDRVERSDSTTEFVKHGTVPRAFQVGPPNPDVVRSLFSLRSGKVMVFGKNRIWVVSSTDTLWQGRGTLPSTGEILDASEGANGLMFAGVGNKSIGSLYRSTDSGQSWNAFYMSDQHVSNSTPLAVSAELPNVLLAGYKVRTKSLDRKLTTHAGEIYRLKLPEESNWTPVFMSGLPAGILYHLLIDSSENLIANYNLPGLFPGAPLRLTGEGVWHRIKPDLSFGQVSVVKSGNYFLIDQDGFYSSSDKGDTWQKIEEPEGESWRPIGLIEDLGNDNLVVESVTPDRKGHDMFLSTDGGQTWQKRGNHPAIGGMRDMKIGPTGTIYVAIDNDIYTSRDTGKSWALDAHTDGDNGTFMKLGTGREGRGVAITFGGDLYVARSGLGTWEKASGSPGNDLFAMATDQYGVIYAGMQSGLIKQSIDNGATWKDFATIPKEDGEILALAISRDGKLYIAATQRRVLQISIPSIPTGLPSEFIIFHLDLH